MNQTLEVSSFVRKLGYLILHSFMNYYYVYKLYLLMLRTLEIFFAESQTITLEKPQVLKLVDEKGEKKTDISNEQNKAEVKKTSVAVQTLSIQKRNEFKITQTDQDQEHATLHTKIVTLKTEREKIWKDLTDAQALIDHKANDVKILKSQKINLENTIANLIDSNNQKEILNERLRGTIDDLRKQNDDFRSIQISQRNKLRDAANEENKSLLLALKQLENDKNSIVSEYQELLQIERNEYSKAVKDLNTKIYELQSKLDR